METARVPSKSSVLDEHLAQGKGASIIALVDALLNEAHEARASDIHLDPTHERLRVRLRIDGVLVEYRAISREIQLEVVSRIKVLSRLRTDEHHNPQDGRFRHQSPSGEPIDVRVSIAPTYYGENAVLRLLVQNERELSLSTLGFEESSAKKVTSAIEKSHGMILVTGPTGSGKTTTLYSLIKMLNKPSVSVVSIEDPIEYSIEGTLQMQVNPQTGLTFAAGLRSIVRQDPDVIMVGEIRDRETAAMAVNASLTGHLLLSTLHTTNAAATLPRLIDMGIDPYLVASTIQLAIGQRLVRKICSQCKMTSVVSQTQAHALEAISHVQPLSQGETLWHGSGCKACNNTGYAGRTAITEILPATPAIKDAIGQKASARALATIAVNEGMCTMAADGVEKVRHGVTTIEEVLRVIHE